MKKAVSYRLDWRKLFLDFLQSGETRLQFCKRHKIPERYFYNRAKGWEEERQAVFEKAKEGAKQIVCDKYKEELVVLIDQNRKLWQFIHAQALKIHQNCMDAEQKTIVKPLRPTELNALASAMETCLKSIRLLENKPGEINENRNNNLHALLVAELEAMGNDNRESGESSG